MGVSTYAHVTIPQELMINGIQRLAPIRLTMIFDGNVNTVKTKA